VKVEAFAAGFADGQPSDIHEYIEGSFGHKVKAAKRRVQRSGVKVNLKFPVGQRRETRGFNQWCRSTGVELENIRESNQIRSRLGGPGGSTFLNSKSLAATNTPVDTHCVSSILSKNASAEKPRTRKVSPYAGIAATTTPITAKLCQDVLIRLFMTNAPKWKLLVIFLQERF
jgi:hypothetical protein